MTVFRFPVEFVLLLGATWVAVACGGSESTGPSTGGIEVTAATSGADLDADGYTVAVDGSAGQPLARNGIVNFSALSAGHHTVTLSGVASNCTVSGENPATVTVTSGATAHVVFQIACAQLPIASIMVSPDRAGVAVGGTVQLTPTCRDQFANVLPCPLLTWASNDPTVAAVTQAGLVSGVGPGSVVVRYAAAAQVGGEGIVYVERPGSVTLAVAPQAWTMVSEGSVMVQPTIRDAAGNALTGRTPLWTSSAPSVATVTADLTGPPSNAPSRAALVRALAPGSATITATYADASAPAAITVEVVSFASVSVGADHTCALTPGGAAYCWGASAAGQLGNGTTTGPEQCGSFPYTVACSTTPLPVSGGFVFVSDSAGDSHTCAVSSASAAYCWGGSSLTPVPVAGGLSFVALTGGWNHTCGLASGGVAYCWGSNRYGQLGTGATDDSPVPAAVAGGQVWSALSAGEVHSCGITTAGAAYCWGTNGAGELGIGQAEPSPAPFDYGTIHPTPVAVVGGLAFATISAGGVVGSPEDRLYTCGLTTAGAAYCWGRNDAGQLGTGLTADTAAPAAVLGGLRFTAIGIGAWHTCGLTTGGTVYCWGSNRAGQLGIGSSDADPHPTALQVAGGLTFTLLSVGFNSNCALSSGGVLYCWGRNDAGQLGTGSTVGSTVPVKVAGQP